MSWMSYTTIHCELLMQIIVLFGIFFIAWYNPEYTRAEKALKCKNR